MDVQRPASACKQHQFTGMASMLQAENLLEHNLIITQQDSQYTFPCSCNNDPDNTC